MDEIDIRRRRAARSQTLFREVNERIVELSLRSGELERSNSYLCECLDTGCSATVEVPYDEYERIPANGNRFFVLSGHEDPVVERVVEATPRYVVVEKVGIASDLAVSADPRKSVSAS